MALGYRTVLTTDASGENLDRVLRILKRWATRKKSFPSMPVEGHVENRVGSTLAALSYQSDASLGFRWVLREAWPPPPYAIETEPQVGETRITLVSKSGALWLWTDVEPPEITVTDASGRTRTEVQYSGTPSFVSDIIDAVEMRDGKAEPLSGFQTIPAGKYVSSLVEVVEDATRIGGVFVTAPPHDLAVDNWTRKLEASMQTLQGLGVGYVLERDAQREFNDIVGFDHRVPSGGMRTYLPGAIPRDPQDSFKHKLLTPATLRTSDERRIRRILRNAQIQRVNDIRLPDVLRDADYEFLRLRQLQPFQVLHRDPEPTDAGASNDETIAELRKSLSDAESMALEAADDSLRYAKQVAGLKEDLDFAEELVTENEQLLRDERLAAEKRARRVAFLESELAKLGAAGADAAYGVWEDTADETMPETFKELYDRMLVLPGVAFYGDKADILDLDEQTSLGVAAVTKAWDALLTLSAYVAAREAGLFNDSLSQYMTYPKHGLLMRASSVVWREGETVLSNGKMLSERTIVVPEAVAEGGSLTFVKHVKLATRRGSSPRLYFEDTYSACGHVAVGPFGAHLTNTLTN